MPLPCDRGQPVVQIVLPLLSFGTAVTAVYFGYVLRSNILQFELNFRGEQYAKYQPCLREVLNECSSYRVMECQTRCCSDDYFCTRSPVVGVYCQDRRMICGNHNYCRDFADISKTCSTLSGACEHKEMVQTYSGAAFVLCCLGFLCDIVDAMVIFLAPNWVHMKSLFNLLSCFFKMLAFGCVWGPGVNALCMDLEEARCYNQAGMDLVAETRQYYYTFGAFEVASAVFAFVQAPISALFGGKLKVAPHVPSSQGQLGVVAPA